MSEEATPEPHDRALPDDGGIPAPLPANEEERLRALYSLGILDTQAEDCFDRITRVASTMLDAPIAVVSLVDRTRQWFKSRVGLDATETPRDLAFCAHAILGEEPLVVSDTRDDERFRGNALVCGEPHIRFYAGVPISLAADLRLGTLCVIDREPRRLSDADLGVLSDLARMVEDQLRLRQQVIELEQARRTLAATNQELDTFHHAVAHDLVTPLRHIAFLTACLQEDFGTQFPPDATPLVDRIHGASSRAMHMIQELGRLSTYSASNTLELSPVDLTAVAEEIRAEALSAPEFAQATISIAMETSSWPAHRTFLREILGNLVSNALKHGGDPPRVELRSSRDSEGALSLSVSDNGPGVGESDRERIFAPFFQISPESSAGMGFGLALVKKLVTLHRGDIQVGSSDSLGGARFAITLPDASRPLDPG